MDKYETVNKFFDVKLAVDATNAMLANLAERLAIAVELGDRDLVQELSHRLEGAHDALMNFCDVDFELLPSDVTRSFGVDFASVSVKSPYFH